MLAGRLLPPPPQASGPPPSYLSPVVRLSLPSFAIYLVVEIRHKFFIGITSLPVLVSASPLCNRSRILTENCSSFTLCALRSVVTHPLQVVDYPGPQVTAGLVKVS